MTNTPTITGMRARPVLVPMRRPPQSASGAIPGASLVLIDLTTSDGITGRAYLFGFQPFTLRPLVGCLEGLFALVQGDPLAPLALEAKLRRALTLLDTPGLVGLALAGLDMAAWDALAQAHGVPLARLLGAAPRPVPAYNSCGLWIQCVDTLADEAEQLAEEGGFSAVKLRLGRADAAEDLAAVRAVMKRVGGRLEVMADFNQRLTVGEALARGRMLDHEGLAWIEEPIRHDDYRGCAQVRAALKTPIQIGENLTSTFALKDALDAGALDYVMPDVQRIGGVTGWLRASALAQAHGVPMSSHLFPELSAHLLAATPTAHVLEYVDWASPILDQPVQLRAGHVVVPERAGTGVAWNEDAVARYALA